MKFAVITGASGGIGSALCAEFRERGYHVVGVDLAAPAAGICDTFVAIDLDRYCRDDGYRLQSNGQLCAAVANGDLHVLVNNAAVQVLGSAQLLTADDWQRTLNVNVVSAFLLTQALLPALAEASGSVVNIASIHATATKPGFVAYATSKAAMVGLTRSLAVDVGGRVRVNAICPAAISTPMLRAGFQQAPHKLDELAAYHPVGRIGEPSEVAKAAAYLASEAAGFVNGAVLALDGGIAARLSDPD